MAGFRTSGATLAAAALVVAAGGFFSLAGSDSVTKGDIRKGAVGKSEIRSNGVGHAELRTGSVRGSEVDEAMLGKVPTAAAADTVGGRSAAQLDTRWALVNESGVIERQTGGFTVVNCYASNANCYIDAGEDLTNNGLSAQIVVANTDASPALSGETGVAPCGATSVNCAPPSTESPNVLVVAPRLSDGTVPGGGPVPNANNAFRFYVFVTGSEG
jgi:hypothetical protein